MTRGMYVFLTVRVLVRVPDSLGGIFKKSILNSEISIFNIEYFDRN